MKRRVFFFGIILLFTAFGNKLLAQELRSSYFMKSSTFRQQMNPALADRPYVGALLGNTNIGFKGNMCLSDFVYKLNNNSTYDLTTFMSPQVPANEFLQKLHDKNKININANYNMFSVGFSALDGINVIEANVKSSTSMCLPYQLFEFMKTTGAKDAYSIENVNGKSINYLELSFGHSQQISRNLTVGAKVKLISGLAYADLDVEHLNLTLSDDVWNIEGEANLSAAILDSKFEYDKNPDPANTDATRGNKVTGLTDGVSMGMPGLGFAFDLGVVYKVPTLKGLTLSASVTDLGAIFWNKTNTASSKGAWVFDGFDNDIYTTGTDDGDNSLSDQFDALGDDLAKVFSLYDDGKKNKRTALPTNLTLAVEYQMPFYSRMSAGMLYTNRFNGMYSIYQTMFSLNICPIDWVEASVNVATTSTGTMMGGMLSFNAGNVNFFVASDSFVFGKLSKQLVPIDDPNANICFGINFLFGKESHYNKNAYLQYPKLY